VRVETGDAFSQNSADLIKHQALLEAGRKFIFSNAIPARAFNKIADFKIKF
jgi:hypothetical protein